MSLLQHVLVCTWAVASAYQMEAQRVARMADLSAGQRAYHSADHWADPWGLSDSKWAVW